MSGHYIWNALSVKGLRERNEDNYLAIVSESITDNEQKVYAYHLEKGKNNKIPMQDWNNNYVRLVLCDGMGGHSQGDIVSREACKRARCFHPATSPQEMYNLVMALHQDLYKDFAGGTFSPGTTIVICDINIKTGHAILASVGDSRAYILSPLEKGYAPRQITYDHSYAEFDYRSRDIDEEAYALSLKIQTNMVTQALGNGSFGLIPDSTGYRAQRESDAIRLDMACDASEQNAHSDVIEFDLKKGEILFLASDGLWSGNTMPIWDGVITENALSDDEMECQVSTALHNGSTDNITMVSFSFTKEEKPVNTYQRRALPIFIAIALLCICIVTWRFDVLHSPQEIVSVDTAPIKEDGVLFQELVDAGLIFQAKEWGANTQMLAYAPSDLLEAHQMRLENATDDHAVYLKRNIALLRELHHTMVGTAVRNAIKSWNSTHVFAGVRDNRPKPRHDASLEVGAEANSEITPEIMYATTTWQAHDARYPVLNALRTNTIPDFCVFVTGGQMRGGFNDWVRFVGEETLRLETVVDLDEPTTITVQVIGNVDDIRPKPKFVIPRYASDKNFKQLVMPIENDDTMDLDSSADEENMAAQLPAKASHKPSHKGLEKHNNPDQKVPEDNGPVLGYEMIFELPKGQTTISFTLDPVAFAIDRVAGQHIRFNRKLEWPESVSWADFRHQTMWHEPASSTITTADGVVLNDKNGLATKAAWDLGLVSLTGLSPHDTNSLEWILSTALEPNDVTLSIEASLQSLAVDCLHKGVEALGADDSVPRRASLVVMDADTGAILAATSYPKLAGDLNLWDVRAFERYYNSQNMRTFKAFKGIDASSAPGSVFKPIVSLAALQYVHDRMEGASAVKAYLKGYTPKEFSEKSGMSFHIVAYNPITKTEYARRYNSEGKWRIVPELTNTKGVIQNFNRDSLSHLLYGGETFGLHQAIKTSANLYFVRLSEIMDPKSEAEAYDLDPENTPWPELYLGGYAKRLGFDGKSLDLLANVPEAQDAAQRTSPSRYGEGDIMYAAPSMLRIQEGKHNASLRMELAQNSIGQAVTVTPLQMARFAASISTGELPTPALIMEFNGVKTPPLPTQTVIPQSLMHSKDGHSVQLLIDGMYSVVNKPNGTAHKAFKDCPVRKHVYGKTGTANIQSSAIANRQVNNSAWFVGWREPMLDGNRRLAFACYITHTSKTGGRAAAPIVADLLTRLATQEPVQ